MLRYTNILAGTNIGQANLTERRNKKRTRSVYGKE